MVGEEASTRRDEVGRVRAEVGQAVCGLEDQVDVVAAGAGQAAVSSDAAAPAASALAESSTRQAKGRKSRMTRIRSTSGLYGDDDAACGGTSSDR